jgi:hypothetical protein
MSSRSTAIEALRTWKEDPVRFVKDVFGVTPDPWQEEILRVFPENQRLAMKACKGPGKTCLIAWLCWNFLATRPHPKIAATSITKDNLSDGLWAEMAKWMHKSKYLMQQFEWNKTRIANKDFPETWWMSARNWSQSGTGDQQANTLAGLHADYIMFVLDEAGGIPDAVMAAAEAALSTGIECKLVMAGNPTHLEGPLYRACHTEAHLWYVVSITGDPDDPMRSPRIDPAWARAQIEKYGRDNPWVLINVFGQFPPASINALLGVDEVKAAMERHIDPENYKYSQKRLGIDVARFGDDSTILFSRQGLASFPCIEMRNATTIEIAERIATHKAEWGSELDCVDGTGGYGAGVVDNLQKFGISAYEIHFNSKANDSRYFNRRSEMWFKMADWIKSGGALPNDSQLLRELTTPTYTFKNDKMFLEKKEQIKDRLGSSPDMADALALTFAIPEQAARDTIINRHTDRFNKMSHEWDPLDEKREKLYK